MPEGSNSLPTVIAGRDPWVGSSELRRILREAPADPALLDDLAEVREADLEEDVGSQR
jgi:hypothetical protein